METNEIILSLNRLGKLYLKNPAQDASYPIPLRLVEILWKSGYILGEETKNLISPKDEETLLKILEPYLERLYGHRRVWKTVFKTPDSIPGNSMEILKQLYATPELLEKIREGQEEVPDFWEVNGWTPGKVIGVAGDKDIQEWAKGVLSRPLPPSSDECDDLYWLGKNRGDLDILPDKPGTKESLSLLLTLGHGREYISGVTDILRMCAFVSTGNGVVTSGLRFPGGPRKIILDTLEWYLSKKPLKFVLEDAWRWKEVWARFGRHYHPGPKKYPRVYHFLGSIGEERSWWSKVQKTYDSKDYRGVIDLLVTRPTEFLRRIDSLLRHFWDTQDTEGLGYLMEKLEGISEATPKALLQLHRYYDTRDTETPRSFLDRRGIRQYYSSLSAMDPDMRHLIQASIFSALKNHWAKDKRYLGQKVKIDLPEGCILPLTKKSGVSEATSDMWPGEKIYFQTSGLLRFFVQWIDPKGTEDLDLHAWLLDDDMGETTEVSWNSRLQVKGVSHSGDIRHQPGDCAEFVNIDYREEIPWTWLLVTVQNFDGPNLLSPESYLGYSTISPDTETQTTEYRGRLKSEAKNIAGYIVNLKEGWLQFILEGISGDVLWKKDLIKSYITPASLGLKEILQTAVEASGGEVVDGEEDLTITKDNIPELLEWILG